MTLYCDWLKAKSKVQRLETELGYATDKVVALELQVECYEIEVSRLIDQNEDGQLREMEIKQALVARCSDLAVSRHKAAITQTALDTLRKEVSMTRVQKVKRTIREWLSDE